MLGYIVSYVGVVSRSVSLDRDCQAETMSSAIEFVSRHAVLLPIVIFFKQETGSVGVYERFHVTLSIQERLGSEKFLLGVCKMLMSSEFESRSRPCSTNHG